MLLAPGSPGPYGMRYPDLPDEQDTQVNPHWPTAARIAEEVIATCQEVQSTERQTLHRADLSLTLSCVWPLFGRAELCAFVPLFLLIVVRDDRLDRGDAAGAAALDKPIAHELERALAVFPAGSAQRITNAATAIAHLVPPPCDSFASLDAYLDYQGSRDGIRMSVEFAAASAGHTYGPLLDAPEAQEFLRLHRDLIRLANDIVGAPREMSQQGDRTNAVILQQYLTGCTAQQGLDACLELHHGMRERYERARQELSRREGFEQMCTDLHLAYSGLLFCMKRSPRYLDHWKPSGQDTTSPPGAANRPRS